MIGFVSIPYGKWNQLTSGQLEVARASFNTLWKMEPKYCDRYSLNDWFQYPMGNGTEKKPTSVSMRNVSIPYGKWNQQQLVVGAIIAYKSLHVKGFSQKIYMLIT